MRTSTNAALESVVRIPRRASAVSQWRGVVVGLEGRVVAVDIGDAIYEARRAVSCLLEPALDDTVLLAVGDDGMAHVLSVLEREEGTRALIGFDGDVVVKVATGQFTVIAQEGIDLASARDVTVTARGMRVSAAEGSVTLDRLAYVGRVVHAEVERVKHVGAVFESVVERVSQRIKRSFRIVEELDQVRAEQIDYSAQKNLHFHGHNALVTAEELIKMDGEQIHLG